MYQYFKGLISEKTMDSITLEVNDIGYLFYVAHPDEFRLNTETLVYSYYHVKEDSVTLYGFIDKESRTLFLKLLSVSGIGPKTVMAMMSATTSHALIQAIETGNTSFLKKLPGIGTKTASQIILDLKGKLIVNDFDSTKDPVNSELMDTYEALKTLGYRASDIDIVLKNLGKEKMPSSDYLRLALQQLQKRGKV